MSKYLSRIAMSNGVHDKDMIKVCVPAATTLRAGNVLTAEALDSAISGNYDVYVPANLVDVTSDEICILLNDGFEVLSDGRRPNGNSAYTTYTYKTGDVIVGVRLNVPNIKLEISEDAIVLPQGVTFANIAVGGKLVPVNGTNTLIYETAETTTTAKNYLKIEAKKQFLTGGVSGDVNINTLIVRSAVLDSVSGVSL